ncbi:MFS transporter [Planococcus kocurii]|uniref:MFS transporter n=1 Tax=Planococcus kocurii TaxID=1374 RepID=UPI003D076E4A
MVNTTVKPEEKVKASKSKIHAAWLVLIGLCIIVAFGKGVVNNSSGLFLTPVSKELGIGIGDLTLYMSISAVVTIILLPVAGKLMAKYDIRLLLIVAIILQGGSFAAFGLMNSVWGWYILAVPLAFGAIFINVIAGPVLINQWFRKNNGLALGILTATGGLIGAFAQPVIGSVIFNQGWRYGYMAVGITAIIVVIPVTLLLIKKLSQNKGLYPYGMTDTEIADQGSSSETQNEGIAMSDAKKSSSFYALMLFFFLITSVASFMMHIPSYIVDKGFTQEFAGTAMGVYMLGVVLGAIIIGMLNDKIGSRNTTIMTMGLGLISISLLLFVTSSATVIFVALVLFAFVTSGIGTLTPSLTQSLFGNKDYSQIYSTASLGLAIAAIVALPAYGYIFQFTGSYSGGLYTILVMLVLAIVAVLYAFKGKEKLLAAGAWKK